MENYDDERKYREVRRKRRRRKRTGRRRYEETQEVDRDLLRSFGHKILAFLIAVVLIIVVFMVAFAGRICILKTFPVIEGDRDILLFIPVCPYAPRRDSSRSDDLIHPEQFPPGIARRMDGKYATLGI